MWWKYQILAEKKISVEIRACYKYENASDFTSIYNWTLQFAMHRLKSKTNTFVTYPIVTVIKIPKILFIKSNLAD